jgi:hypothetical protein
MDEVGGTSISPSLNLGDISFSGKNAEIKVSFLSQDKTYCLTHIRMWQEFDMYLFCLIDCDNNFTPEFYLIDKFIIDNVKMGPMNGTKLSNIKNKNVELRVTIRKGGDSYNMFKRFNKLNGTTLSDLKLYISN